MPTYAYKCGECGCRREIVSSMATRPETVTCECGKEAERAFDAMPHVAMVNSEYEFRPENRVVNFGKKYGRTAQQQHEHYREYFSDIKKRKRALQSSAKKHQGLEWIGGMPGEMADTIGMQEGDPEAVAKDPETYLKKTGMWDG